MSPEAAVRLCPTADLAVRERADIRALLDAAFDGDFGDGDWANAIGGIHAVLETAEGVVAHASVVPRTLDVGGRRLRAGYVEAVAVRPALQRRGFGTAVMRALAAVIARDHELGVLSSGEWHFYERLGWKRWQGPTWVRQGGRCDRTPDDDDGIMFLPTPATGGLDPASPITCEARAGDPW
jgi:aminoglycoside 2'-N-acetyltransferase I